MASINSGEDPGSLLLENKIDQCEIADAHSNRKLMNPVCNHIKMGVIGTTNVGKSTLFNVFSKGNNRRAETDDCLFCTIDPSISTVSAPDTKFEWLVDLLKPSQSSRTMVSMIDTAGLVKGSYLENKGLGCASLAALKDVDVILHVIRGFENSNIVHYEASLDPIRDLEIVNQELLLWDIDAIEKQLINIETIKHDRMGAEYLQFQYSTLIKAWQFIAGRIRPEPDGDKLKKPRPIYKRSRIPKVCTGSAVRFGKWERREREILSSLNLISAKEVIYLVNETARDYLRKRQTPTMLAVSAAVSRTDMGYVPSEVIQISLEFEDSLDRIERYEDPVEYHRANPTHISALPLIIATAYRVMGIHHFYMANEKMVKCFGVKEGTTLKEASAFVDVNIYRNFIRGDVIQFDDYYSHNGDKISLQLEGKLKSESKKYVINDDDVIEFFWHTHK